MSCLFRYTRPKRTSSMDGIRNSHALHDVINGAASVDRHEVLDLSAASLHAHLSSLTIADPTLKAPQSPTSSTPMTSPTSITSASLAQSISTRRLERASTRRHSNAEKSVPAASTAPLFERFAINLQKKYGEGGYGATFAARNLQTNEALAVKKIDVRRWKPEAVVKEAQILELLNHRNVIRVEGHGHGLAERNQQHLYL